MKTSLQTIGNSINSGASSFGSYCVETFDSVKKQVSSYFESKDYESDLDSIIEALYAHTKKRPDFGFSEDFKERVKQKKDFLTGQAGKLIIGGALSGAWAAIESGNLPMVGEYTLIGAAGAVLIIIVTVSGVVIKRVTENTGMSFSKTSKAVEIFKSRWT